MKSWKTVLALLLLFHLLLLVLSKFTAWPEMLFWPYLVLKGWLPYHDIGIAHSPLLVLALAGFYKVFGVGIWQQQIFSWSLILLTDILIFAVLRRLFDLKTALIAICFYVFFQIYYDGNGIWFDHTLAIFSVAIFYFLNRKKYFPAGLFFGLALLTKQTAFWFLLPILVIRPKTSFFKAVLFLALVAVSVIGWFGLINDFYFWAIKFGIGDLSRQSSQINLPRWQDMVVSLAPFLIFIPLSRQKHKNAANLFLWSTTASLGAFPRFELFHFQPALPFLAAAFAISFKKPSWLTYLIVISTLILAGRSLARNLLKPIRFQGDRDKEIVKVVDGMTDDNELIFVTNYWDNLYPLTDTLPATRPFVPQLTQYITPSFDQSLAADLLVNQPRLVVRGQFTGPDDPYRFEKINNFIDNHYQIVTAIGGVDILELK